MSVTEQSGQGATLRGTLRGQVVVVTGSNTGIGRETALALARMGATTVLGCRDSDKSRAARDAIAADSGNPDVQLFPLDLADGASIRAFAARCARELPRLDVLVNNAGASPTKRLVTKDGFEATFGVNHFGTFLLTCLLVPLLERSAPSRVVTVASGLHRRGKLVWDDLEFTKRPYSFTAAYNASKLANVLFTKALAARLVGTGVTANCLEPGFARTGLRRDVRGVLRGVLWVLYRFAMTPAEGARLSITLASAPELTATSGEYFDKGKPARALAMTDAIEPQERLWTLSEAKWGLEPWRRPTATGAI